VFKIDAKLVFAISRSRLVHISEVESGLIGECYCPYCGGELIARKGQIKVHHFAHYNSAECSYGLETAIHLAIKEIIEKNKKMYIPSVEIDIGTLNSRWIISNSRIIKFNSVVSEKRTDGIIPDIIAKVKNAELLVEVKVTHGVDEEKKKRIHDLGYSALEVDLFDLRNVNFETLEEVLLKGVKRISWLNNNLLNNVSSELKNIAEKKTIKNTYNAYIQDCPKENEIKYTYVSTCQKCEYYFGMDIVENGWKEKLYCLEHVKIKNYKDYQKYKENVEV